MWVLRAIEVEQNERMYHLVKDDQKLRTVYLPICRQWKMNDQILKINNADFLKPVQQRGYSWVLIKNRNYHEHSLCWIRLIEVPWPWSVWWPSSCPPLPLLSCRHRNIPWRDCRKFPCSYRKRFVENSSCSPRCWES